MAHKTLDTAITATIQQAARDILEYMALGMTLNEATAQVMGRSTLGPASKARVMGLVHMG